MHATLGAHALDDEYQMFDFESWQSLSAETREDCIGTTPVLEDPPDFSLTGL